MYYVNLESPFPCKPLIIVVTIGQLNCNIHAIKNQLEGILITGGGPGHNASSGGGRKPEGKPEAVGRPPFAGPP